MSKILRRPMFRGGPVDSYGTGIASGLADGGRVGYKKGRFVTGSDVVKGASEAHKLYGNLYGSKGARGMGKNTGVDPVWGQLYGGSDFQEGDKPDLPMNYNIPDYLDTTVSEDLIDTSIIDTSTGSDAEENQPDVAEAQIKGITTVDKGNVDSKGNLDKTENPETLEISVEDQITQQAELFDKLFSKNMEAKNKERLKKARIQDISDVGLDIFARSTKPGADVKTMLGEAAERMVDKPSRTEVLQAKIDDQGDKRYQTSVALAVNDYIAGKRSKEATEKLLASKGIDLENALTRIRESANINVKAERGKSITSRMNEDKTGRTTKKKIIGHTQEWMEDNNISGVPTMVDQTQTKVDLVEENKNKIFIDEKTKEVFTIVDDGKGGLVKRIIYGTVATSEES